VKLVANSMFEFSSLSCLWIFRNVLTSQEVVDFVSERLEKQSDADTVSLSKICEEVIVLFKL
jgi:hypothetical protein